VKPPVRLQPLLDEGLIDAVMRQLKSGKEATVYVVRCSDAVRCAKVYKVAEARSFRQAVDYTENRRVRNSRQARAMAKGTRYGRSATEAAWQSAEVDALRRLAAAGVRVPQPFQFVDGVLLMELVVDADGSAAPRVADVEFSPDEARAAHAALLREVVRMLLTGVIHGDLSEFNVLMAADGPVIIDLPQAVDAAGNNHAQRMLLRDVANLNTFFGGFAPELLDMQHGPELWDRYAHGTLDVDTVLTGHYTPPDTPVDLGSVMREIEDTLADEAERRARLAENG
jgi:RIO kinase 1